MNKIQQFMHILSKGICYPQLPLIRLVKSHAKWFSDEQYLKTLYWLTFHRRLNMSNPEGFNAKLQWMKIYDRRPQYVTMVDKYAVRAYVRQKIGDEYLIPLIGVWDDPEEINFDVLPQKFVLKCNHNSGIGMTICRDKSELNVDATKKKLVRGLQDDYFVLSKEWPYSQVKRRIIAEELLEYKDSQRSLEDYKFQCFNGVVDNVFICEGRFSKRGVRYHYFDREWNYLPYCPYPDVDSHTFTWPKPEHFEEMLRIAENLSAGFPEVRVDLYNVDGKIYFGELTLFSQSGLDTDITREADMNMGKKLHLQNEVTGGE